MTSRDSIKTPKEYRQDFDRNLKSAIEIGEPPDYSAGFDTMTFDLLTDIANAYPKTKPSLIKEARQSFADFIEWWVSD